MQLSRNFTLDEFRAPAVSESAPESVEAGHLPAVVERAQWLRDLTSQRLKVTSYWRSPAHNAAVAGVSTSQHLTGDAVDLLPLDGMPLDEIARRVLRAMQNGTAPVFGQLILYADEGHVHLSAPFPAATKHPNNQVFFSPGLEPGTNRRSYIPITSLASIGRLFDVGGPLHGSAALVLLLGILAALLIAWA